MIGDPNLLAAETIKLPSPKDMNVAQVQRVVNMAAIVVATRVTGKMLAKAQANFANVENDYSQLIAGREAVAKLLYDVLLKAGPAAGPASPELEGLSTEEDLAHLHGDPQRRVHRKRSSRVRSLVPAHWPQGGAGRQLRRLPAR